MSSLSLTVEMNGYEALLRRLKPILEFEPSELMSVIGAIGESHTRRRIEEEKTAPDGTPWLANSQGRPILVESGQHLLYSIAWRADATEAEWGSTWEHAHVHQEGMVIKPKNGKALAFTLGGNQVFAKSVTIPARPFVGLSAENEAEILDVVSDFFGVAQ